MQALKKELMGKDALKKCLVILFTAITGAIAMNMFLIPANIFSAGANGIAQIISRIFSDSFGIGVNTGFLILLINIPIAILGFYKLGVAAVLLSFINTLGISLAIMVMPHVEVTDNPLMAAVVGGVLLGIGVGLSLKYGFTTGGMDIVVLVLSKTTGRTVGNLMLVTNAAIIAVAGFLFDWETALYTIISIYAMITVVDMIHTSQQKLTAMIITTLPDEVSKALTDKMVRGMTLIPSYGGYSKRESRMIMMVVSSYELYDLENIVTETDPGAFMDIIPTKNVIGRFANEDEQKYFKTTGSWPELKKKK